MIDEETLRLSRECAEARGIALSAWLALAADHHGHWEEGRRNCAEVLAELGVSPDEESKQEVAEWYARYAPSGPSQRVSTALDEELLGRVRENARHAELSVSAWLALAAWFHTQMDPGLWRYEQRFGKLVRPSRELLSGGFNE